MSTSIDERARELGLPTNVEETAQTLWVTSRYVMPQPLDAFESVLRRIGTLYFATEKEAIHVARQLRIEDIDRLQNEVNVLDERYDRIEDEEMAQEKRRINDPD